MQLLLTQDLRLEITGGLTGHQTVFPAVEDWLAADSDRYRSFEILRGRRDTGKYRSVIDFLLGEVCPSERAVCFAFYRGEGPLLLHVRTERQLRFLETKLLLFLTVAYEAFCQRRRLSWNQAVQIVDDVCARAA